MAFSYRVESMRNEDVEATVLRLYGEFDYSVCNEVDELFVRLTRIMPKLLVVDISEVSYIDSSGLGELIALHERTMSTDSRVILVVAGQIPRVLETTGLDQILDIVPSLLDALEVTLIDTQTR